MNVGWSWTLRRWFARVAGPQAVKRLAHLPNAFAAAEHATETVGMHVIEAQKQLGSLGPPVRRAHRLGMAARGPGGAPERFEFERPPFVEADHRRARRALPVELPDAFFLRSNAGS